MFYACNIKDEKNPSILEIITNHRMHGIGN